MDLEGNEYSRLLGSTSSEPATYVRASGLGFSADTYEETNTGSGFSFAGFRNAPPGEYLLVVAVAGSGIDVGMHVRVPAGTSVVAESSGKQAFLHRTGAWRGETEGSVVASGVGVQYIERASVSESVSSALFGWFSGSTPQAGSLSYSSPEGSGADSTDYQFVGSGSGTYSFDVESISAGFPYLEAFGADVQLPQTG